MWIHQPIRMTGRQKVKMMNHKEIEEFDFRIDLISESAWICDSNLLLSEIFPTHFWITEVNTEKLKYSKLLDYFIYFLN